MSDVSVMRKVIPAAVLIVLLSVSLYTVLDINGGSLDFSGRHAVLIISDSMDGDVHGYDVDSFPADTLVVVRDATERDRQYISVGQVISYQQDGLQIFHRVYEVHDGYVFARGDNGHSFDKVYTEDIDGIAVGCSPWLGKVVSVIGSNFTAFLAVMFIICSVLVILSLRHSDRRKEAD